MTDGTNAPSASPAASATPAPAASSTPASGGTVPPSSLAEPSPATVSAEATAAKDFFDGFSSMDEDFVEVVQEPKPAAVVEEKPAPAAPVAQATPTPTPAVPIPATPPKEPQPAATPAPAVAAEQPKPGDQQPPASAPSEVTPQSLIEQLAANQQALIPVIAQQRFQLTKEEADALDLNASEAVPKLLARVYMESTGAALQHIHNLVPRMIAQQVRAMKVTEENETAFYKQFPAIDRVKHQADVMQFGKAFRSQPGITQADLFAMIGAAVMAKHGLSMPAAGGGNGVAAPAPAQPAIVNSAPFVPATGGAHTRTEIVDESPFAGLGREYDD